MLDYGLTCKMGWVLGRNKTNLEAESYITNAERSIAKGFSEHFLDVSFISVSFLFFYLYF